MCVLTKRLQLVVNKLPYLPEVEIVPYDVMVMATVASHICRQAFEI